MRWEKDLVLVGATRINPWSLNPRGGWCAQEYSRVAGFLGAKERTDADVRLLNYWRNTALASGHETPSSVSCKR